MQSACSSMATESTGADVLRTYCRVMNSRSYCVASRYFSDNIVLDWFGRTVVGKNNVLNFLLEEVCVSNHDIVEVKSRREWTHMYSFERAIGRFRPPSLSEKDDDFDMGEDSGFNSGIYEVSSDSSFSSSGSLTPCSKIASGISRLHVSNHKEDRMSLSPVQGTPSNTRAPTVQNLLHKKQPFLLRGLKQEDVPNNLQFIDAAGIISFHTGDKFFSPEKDFGKPCHVQIGYQHQQSLKGVLFSFLLYNSDMPCRRNLSQVFDQCQ